MIKKKSKQASAAKELSSTLMQMANWLRYKEGWLPDAATRQAWLCQHALERLGEGVVQLQYVKEDGTKRIARGTLCRGVSEAYDSYVYKGKIGVKKTEKGYFTFAYWDLDEGGFRSFNAARLDDYLVTQKSQKSQKEDFNNVPQNFRSSEHRAEYIRAMSSRDGSQQS